MSKPLNVIKKAPRAQRVSKSNALDETSTGTPQHFAQFLSNSKGEIEHVVLHIDDWERLAVLDPVYRAKNKQEGIQLNVMLPEGKLVRIPHAVAFMVFKHGYNLLKAWRHYRGYTQSDFEDEGIRQPTMFQMEKSTRSRLSTLKSLSEIYGCDIDQLSAYMIDTEEKSKNFE